MNAMPTLVFGEVCLPPDSGCNRHGCGKALSFRQKRWCSAKCRDWFYENHRWTQARGAAMARAGGRCERPGCDAPADEVDHIIERNGTPLHSHSCLHHKENLRALCHDCHLTRYQWDVER